LFRGCFHCQSEAHFHTGATQLLAKAVRGVSGGMKAAESWRFEIPFSSAAFSSST
jgi:hypothetical protein